MKLRWRHWPYVLIIAGIMLVLQGIGALVLPTALDPARVPDDSKPRIPSVPTPSPTLATASATPLPSPTATPVPTGPVVAVWPQPVPDPLAITMIVNKKYYLTSSFVPPDLRVVGVPHTNNHPLRNVAAAALEEMVAAAARDGVSLRLLSGYRSYATQRQLYNGYVSRYGRTSADRFSARPGHSEHQSGLALDIGDAKNPACDVAQCFADTAGGRWIASHAPEYGFIIRYASDKEAITGYMAEPWHIRYVGISLARQLVSSGQAMEEYFKVDGGGY